MSDTHFDMKLNRYRHPFSDRFASQFSALPNSLNRAMRICVIGPKFFWTELSKLDFLVSLSNLFEELNWSIWISNMRKERITNVLLGTPNSSWWKGFWKTMTSLSVTYLTQNTNSDSHIQWSLNPLKLVSIGFLYIRCHFPFDREVWGNIVLTSRYLSDIKRVECSLVGSYRSSRYSYVSRKSGLQFINNFRFHDV